VNDVRGLVVGLGSIGRRHARNWASLGLGPLAVCRLHKQLQHEPQQPLQVEYTEYHNLDRALEAWRPDVVLVTNPTSLHVETTRSALQAGAHVLVEKPLGSTLDGIGELVDAARASCRTLMVAYNLRFHPGLKRLKALVAGNAIGRVISARAEVGEYLPDWHPWEDYRRSYSGRRDLGGGAMLTFSHELDALCWLLGAPRRLAALTSHASSLEVDTEDVAELVLQFESGALGSVHVDYVRRPPRRAIEVVGEIGTLRWDYERNRLELFLPDVRQWRLEQGDPTYARNQMYVDELQHFVACVRGEIVQPLVDGEQGAAVLAIALAALESSRTGRTVDFRSHDGATRAWLRRLGSTDPGQ
jgi:predicted dehydrogenase